MKEVWGTAVMSQHAARALGDQRHHNQVRAVVLANSRAAAGRSLADADAGFFNNGPQAARHLATWGATSGNPREIETCTTEGQVYVSSMNQPRPALIPWPPEG